MKMLTCVEHENSSSELNIKCSLELSMKIVNLSIIVGTMTPDF